MDVHKVLMRLLEVANPLEMEILLRLHAAGGRWLTTADVAAGVPGAESVVAEALRELAVGGHVRWDVRFRTTGKPLPEHASLAQTRVMRELTPEPRSYAELNPNRTSISGTKITVNWLVANGHAEVVDIWRASESTDRKLTGL